MILNWSLENNVACKKKIVFFFERKFIMIIESKFFSRNFCFCCETMVFFYDKYW